MRGSRTYSSLGICMLAGLVACGGSSISLNFNNGDASSIGAGGSGVSSGATGNGSTSGAGTAGASAGVSSGSMTSGAAGAGTGASTTGAPSGSPGSGASMSGASSGTAAAGASTGTSTTGATSGTSSGTGVTPSCVLATDATDIYVDSRYVGPPRATGAAGCPFPTIRQGVAAATNLTAGPTRTVHVAGATPALVYNEASSVVVNANIVVQGDGSGKTTINASGPCATPSAACAVIVEASGVLDGFTVVSAAGDGIESDAGDPVATIRNVAASGSKGDGIVALGGVDLGPNIAANGNAGQGVESMQGATGIVHVLAGTNAFNHNGANGLNIDGAATLKFDGGAALGNALNGIRLFGVSAGLGTVRASHSIAGLDAEANQNTGISAFNGQVLKVRSSTLFANANEGLYYAGAAGGSLDIGTTADPGANAFGGATVGTQNGKAGIFLCRVVPAGGGLLPAEADTWSACPPTQTAVVSCDDEPATYADVGYAPPTGDPVVATTCIVGP
jgi:hypothetical protein